MFRRTADPNRGRLLAAIETLYEEFEDYERGCLLAKELIEAKKPAAAVKVLDALLRRDPKNAKAKALHTTASA